MKRKRGSKKRKNSFKNEIKNLGSKKSKRILLISLVLLIVIVLSYFVYLYFFVAVECNDLNCYRNAVSDSCKKVWVINEDEQYVWRYEVVGRNGVDSCNVEVRLLKIKNGNIKAEGLQDKLMVCKVFNSGDILPEKDMLRCSGLLKEDLQEIIINRIHNYILQNLGEINEELRVI